MIEKSSEAIMLHGINSDADAIVCTKTAYKDVVSIEDEFQGQKGYIIVTTRASKVSPVSNATTPTNRLL
jgi:hypothetical protein